LTMHVCEHQLLLLPPARPLGERFGAEFFRALPEGPGVYLLCGARDGILYVGKAKNLRKRLGSYRSANPDRLSRRLRRLLSAVERIHWHECDTEAAALDREGELIRELRPRFNVAGVFPGPAEYLGWQIEAKRMVIGCDRDSRRWSERIGPWSRLRPVCRALARLGWRHLHPEEDWTAMPRELSHGWPRDGLAIATNGAGDRLDEFTQRLAHFARTGDEKFVLWLMGLNDLSELPDLESKCISFELRWAAEDAGVLLQMGQRLARRAGRNEALEAS